MNNNFIKYPAIIFCSTFIASLYLTLLLKTEIKFIIHISCLVIAAVTTLLILKIDSNQLKLICKYTALVCSAVILSITVQLIRYDVPMSNSEKYIGKTVSVTAYVKETIYTTDNMSAAHCVITEIEQKPCNITVYAFFEGALTVNEFDYFNTDFTLSNSNDAINDYNTKYSLIASDIELYAHSIESPTPTGNQKTGIIPFFSKINERICNLNTSLLSPRSAALINAVLFGNKEQIPMDVSRDFYTLGITHLLVVSGMNIAILAGEAEFILLHVFKLSRKKRNLICSFISLLYMALCGFSLTVIRAALMQVICRLSVTAKAQYHTITSLFIAATVITVIFPGAIYDIGLILSFLATLGIISFGQYIEPNLKKLPVFIKSVISSLTASLSAGIFVLPISVAVFGKFSLVAPIATLIFGLFLDILLYLAPLLIVTSFIPFVSVAVSFVTNLVCSFVINLTSSAYLFKDMYLSLNYKGIEILTVLLIISIILGFLLKSKYKILKVLPALVVFMSICLISYINSDSDGVHYYRDKSNDSIIMCQENNCTLIDISTGSNTFTKKAVNSAYQSCNSTNIDNYVITHYHKLQLAAIETLSNTTYLENIYLPSPSNDEDEIIYQEICSIADKQNITTVTYNGSFSCGNSIFSISQNEYISRSTHPIVILKFDFNSSDISYFSGGAFEINSSTLTELSKSDFLIFGNHGPITKEKISNPAFNDSATVFFANESLYQMCDQSFFKVTVAQDGYITVVN